MKPWAIGVIVLLVAWSLTTHGKYSASGDEPHYLMVTQSLVADRDLDVLNNYAQDDGRLFGHEQLQMEAHARVARDGRTLPVHDIGLSIFVLPAYVAARRLAAIPSEQTIRRFRMNRGLLAYSIVSFCLVALTAAAVALLFAALVPLAGRRAAAVVTLAAALSPPIVSHAFLVFPEVPAFAVTCAVLWFVTAGAAAEHETRGTKHDLFVVLALAFVLGLLPWAHRKYSFYVLGLAALIVWRRRALVRGLRRSELATAAALFVVPQLALHAWTIATWGSIGGPQFLQSIPFSAASFARGSIGIFADRTSGLLAYAPIYWIVPACCVLTWRETWPFVAVAALLAVPMASWTEWWAGFAPAGRYLVPLMPLLAVPLALAMRHRAIRVAFTVLAAGQAVIDAYVWQHPRTLWPSAIGANAALERLGPIARGYESILPPLRVAPFDWRAVVVIAVVGASVVAAAVACRPLVLPQPRRDELA